MKKNFMHYLIWIIVGIVGASSFAGIAFVKNESVS